jgi:hypothetical protein
MASNCRYNGVAYSELFVVSNSLRLRGKKITGETPTATPESLVGERVTANA